MKRIILVFTVMMISVSCKNLEQRKMLEEIELKYKDLNGVMTERHQLMDELVSLSVRHNEVLKTFISLYEKTGLMLRNASEDRIIEELVAGNLSIPEFKSIWRLHYELEQIAEREAEIYQRVLELTPGEQELQKEVDVLMGIYELKYPSEKVN